MGKYELLMVILSMDIIVSGGRFDGGGYGFVDGLRMEYYMMSCPFAEGIVKNTVNRHLQADPTLAAALVRMHFHDCFVQVTSNSLSFYIIICMSSFWRITFILSSSYKRFLTSSSHADA